MGRDIEEIKDFLDNKIIELDAEENAEAINSYQMALEHLDYAETAEYLNQSNYGGEDYEEG